METTQEDLTGPNELAERTGPFYDIDGICSWLGITEDDVHDRILNDELLAVFTVDDVPLFPVWQFEENGSLNSNLQETLAILNEGIRSFGDASGWMVAWWLCATYGSAMDGVLFDGIPIYAHLKNGELVEEIQSLAVHDAMCWGAV
jgi:hypothetical protein